MPISLGIKTIFFNKIISKILRKGKKSLPWINMFLYQYKEMSLTRIWDNLESGNYLNKSSIHWRLENLTVYKIGMSTICFNFIS